MAEPSPGRPGGRRQRRERGCCHARRRRPVRGPRATADRVRGRGLRRRHVLQDRPSRAGRRRAGMARPRRRRPHDPRPFRARVGRARRPDRPPRTPRPRLRRLAHHRAGRAAGAQLAARPAGHLPEDHRRRPGHAPGSAGRGAAGPGRRWPRPGPAADPTQHRPPVHRDGAALRPPRSRRPGDDVLHRISPGLPGRRRGRCRGRRPMGSAARARPRARRPFRQLSPPWRPPHRLAMYQAGDLVSDRPVQDQAACRFSASAPRRHRRRRSPPGVLRPVRARRRPAGRAAGRRAVGRARRSELPGLAAR